MGLDLETHPISIGIESMKLEHAFRFDRGGIM